MTIGIFTLLMILILLIGIVIAHGIKNNWDNPYDDYGILAMAAGVSYIIIGLLLIVFVIFLAIYTVDNWNVPMF